VGKTYAVRRAVSLFQDGGEEGREGGGKEGPGGQGKVHVYLVSGGEFAEEGGGADGLEGRLRALFRRAEDATLSIRGDRGEVCLCDCFGGVGACDV